MRRRVMTINRPRLTLFVVAAGVGLLSGVGGCSVVPVDTQPPITSCDGVTPLFDVTAALDAGDHACGAWLEATHGRVARLSSASAVVWSRRTTFGTAVLASAMHVLGAGWFGPTGEDIAAAAYDPAAVTGVARITLIAESGTHPDDRISPMFDLYHPSIPAAVNTQGMPDILPRNDFALAVLDDQELNRLPLLEIPDDLHDAPTAVFDPEMLTATAPTYAAAVPGEDVLLLGYPAASPYAGALTAGVGRVLTDAEAEAAIVALAAQGDVEGNIPYDAEAEFLIDAAAAGGMSGGGIFDRDNRLIGILVRASDPHGGGQYVRAVRMTFIAASFRRTFEDAPPDLQERIAPYIEPFE